MNEPCMLAQVQGKLRRAFLVSFRRDYVRQQGTERHGACRQCGACCRIVFRCPFLDGDNRCAIYGLNLRPLACQAFPVDARDLREVKGECGFSFTKTGVPAAAPECVETTPLPPVSPVPTSADNAAT